MKAGKLRSTLTPAPTAARWRLGKGNSRRCRTIPANWPNNYKPWRGRAQVRRAGRFTSTASRAETFLPNRPSAKFGSTPIRFSAEYDRTGFGRIEIFTKPGTDALHGQAFFQFNDQYLNSRSPLYTQSSSLPPYKNQFEGFNLSGPVKKDKASFTLDFEQRDITENAFILATNLNSNLVPQTMNQGLLTPQTRTSITPRLDYAINAKKSAGHPLSIRPDGHEQRWRWIFQFGVHGLPSEDYGEQSASHGDGGAESAADQ